PLGSPNPEFSYPNIHETPYGFNEIFLADRLSPPSAAHLMGTDDLGRDLLSRCINGARISMIVSLSVTIMAAVGSLALGITSGYMGGKVDLFIQRINDAVQVIPTLLVILTIMAIVGPGLLQVIFVLGGHAALTSRTERSYVMAIKENVYFEAAKAIGASTSRIMLRHVMPNIFPLVIVKYSLSMGRVIIQEAMLSFLGFGIPPPFPSWGGMLSGTGRRYMLEAPWMLFWPGVCLFLVIYGINVFGDGLRDLLDPRLRGGLGRYGGMTRKKIEKLVGKKDTEK
ncbi:ABC transporter permease, partial [Chloroflexota bacterium]